MSGPGISHERMQALARLLAEAGVDEADLEEKFMRASGPGGQHVNKTSSAVALTHRPTQRTVRVQTSRSQAQNRYRARKQLAEEILAERLGKKTALEQEREKVRRQKRRRSRRSKARMLADKNHQAGKKSQRKRPDASE